MKTISKVIVITLVLFSSTLFAGAIQSDPITVLESKGQYEFLLKLDRSIFGGTIEVYHSNGDLVTSIDISKRKATIDFKDVKFGMYTIKVIKDGTVLEEFEFNKELILSQVVR